MNPILAGSLLYVQKHQLPGKWGKEKAGGTSKFLIKVKKHSGSFKCNAFRCERRATFMCVKRHCEGKVLWNCGNCQAWNKHQQSHTRMLDLFVCVCLSTHQPHRESTHLLSLQFLPNPHSMVRTAGLGVCITPAFISKHEAPPIMDFAHLITPFIGLQNHRIIWVAMNL